MNYETVAAAKHKFWEWLVDSYSHAGSYFQGYKYNPIDNLGSVWKSSDVLKVKHYLAAPTMQSADKALKKMADNADNIYNEHKEKSDDIIKYFIRTCTSDNGDDDMDYNDNINGTNVNISALLNEALEPIRRIIIQFVIGKVHSDMKKSIEYKLTYLPLYASRFPYLNFLTLESWWMETMSVNKKGNKQELHINGIKIEPHSIQTAGKDFYQEIQEKLNSENVQGLPYIVISKSNFMTNCNNNHKQNNKSFFDLWQEWVCDFKIWNLNNERIVLENEIKAGPPYGHEHISPGNEPYLTPQMFENQYNCECKITKNRRLMIVNELIKQESSRNNLVPLTPCNVVIPLSHAGVKIFDVLYQESVANGNIDCGFKVDLIFIE